MDAAIGMRECGNYRLPLRTSCKKRLNIAQIIDVLLKGGDALTIGSERLNR